MRHTRTDLQHLPRALMAQDERTSPAERVPIRMTDPAGLDAYQHFSGAGRVETDVLNAVSAIARGYGRTHVYHAVTPDVTHQAAFSSSLAMR